MRYVLFSYADPAAADDVVDPAVDGGQPTMAEHDALADELRASGELVESAWLADPPAATIVRVRGGGTTSTAGPFAGVRARLTGYLLVEVASRERAEAIGVRLRAASAGAVELRATVDPGTIMDR